MTKDELKQLKKSNKFKLSYQNIMQFERDHRIQPTSEAVQRRLKELWSK